MVTTQIASFRDIPALVEMMCEFYAESNRNVSSNRAMMSFSALLSNRDVGRVIVANDGSPAGYIVLTLRFNFETCGFDGYIGDVYVRPKFRRRKIASELLTHLFREAAQQQFSAVHVETDIGNTVAVALYEGHGMKNSHLGILTRRM